MNRGIDHKVNTGQSDEVTKLDAMKLVRADFPNTRSREIYPRTKSLITTLLCPKPNEFPTINTLVEKTQPLRTVHTHETMTAVEMEGDVPTSAAK